MYHYHCTSCQPEGHDNGFDKENVRSLFSLNLAEQVCSSCEATTQEEHSMTKQHTPGPWYTGTPEWPNKVFSRDRHAVAMAECNYMNGDEEDIANARLIAAAPDLLTIVAELARYDGLSGSLPELIVQARAAIDKATTTQEDPPLWIPKEKGTPVPWASEE